MSEIAISMDTFSRWPYDEREPVKLSRVPIVYVPDMPCSCVVVTIVALGGANEGATPYITTRPITRPITKVPIAIVIGFFFVSDIKSP